MKNQNNIIIDTITKLTQIMYNINNTEANKYTNDYFQQNHINLNDELIQHGKLMPYVIGIGKQYQLNAAKIGEIYHLN